MGNQEYKVWAIVDSETTNIDDSGHAAFVTLYQVNDLTSVPITKYVPGKSDDIRFYKTTDEVMSYLRSLIEHGKDSDVIPIVAFYNMMFDLQTLKYSLASMGYDTYVSAQSSTHVYTIDILEGSRSVLRLWDTYFLENGGLATMGMIAGLPKATGDWDYALQRTPSTELSEDEKFYASRDVQVIPAYLRYLLEANEWMEEEDLGVHVITKTSIVRQMAKRTIGGIKGERVSGSIPVPLAVSFGFECKQELPKTYESYATRTAAFTGGFTFTAARTASTITKNVVSLDVTSMHHQYINGMMIPRDFKPLPACKLDFYAQQIISTPMSSVLASYSNPFEVAIHARIRFTNLRLKEGSAFEYYGIALLAMGKFASKPARIDGFDNMASAAADDQLRTEGWRNTARGAVFAFGKLYSADSAMLFLNEQELWNVGQVYDYDSMEVLSGEATRKFSYPPEYVTLQSNILFKMKSAAKVINKQYHEGVPYSDDIPDVIPQGITDMLRKGTCSEAFFENWYQSTVKGMFNGIYGTQAMNLFRPGFVMDALGEIHVDHDTVVSKETFVDKLIDIKHPMVLYTYGMRIVGGSRMELVIAIELIHKAYGSQALITGGDTDSMKVSLDGITPDDLITALKPLHIAVRKALDTVQAPVRKKYPQFTSDLKNVGTFDIEVADKDTNTICYEEHYEAWNKARVSWVNGHSHITCAGLSRPAGKYNIEDVIDDLVRAGHPFSEIAPLILGYNTTIDPAISYELQRTSPASTDMFDANVLDYKGDEAHVRSFEAIALFPSWLTLGDPTRLGNLASISYLRVKYGRDVNTDLKEVTLSKTKSVIYNGKKVPAPLIVVGQVFQHRVETR